jgi:fibronectin-binding autotransporter adhesin
MVSFMLLFAGTARAGTIYYWYGSDTTLGGAGTWDTGVTTNKAWDTTTTYGSGLAWPNTTDYDAYFDTSGATVNLNSGSVTAGGLTIARQSYVISSGTLALGGDGIAVNVGSAHGTSTISAAVNLLADQIWTVNTGTYRHVLLVSGVVSGDYALTKAGSGTLTFSAANTYTGGTTLSNGWLAMTSTATFGSGGVTLSGGTLATMTANAWHYISGNVTVSGGINATVCRAASGASLELDGSLLGSGTLSVRGGSGSLGLKGDNSDFSGTIIDYSTSTTGQIRLFDANSGSAKARFILNSDNSQVLTLVAGTFYLGDLSGAATGATLRNYGVANTFATFVIGGAGVTSTYAGHIYDVSGGTSSTIPVAITKVGNGTWTLSGTSAYTGGTSIEAGALLVNGSLTSAVNVIGGVLGGSGSVAGDVSVGAATLAPGSSPATLTIAGVLGLTSGSTLSYELCGTNTTAGGGVNDLIQSVTDLTLDGTLNVAETVAGSFLVAEYGDTWTLITYTNSLTNNGLLLGSVPTLAEGLQFAVVTKSSQSGGGTVGLVVVPEPATLALLASGLIGLIAYAWRKRK